MWIKNPDSDNKSATLTVFIIGGIVATLKLLLSGITIGTVKIESFSGMDYAAAITALGGIYTLRKYTNRKKEDKNGKSEHS